MAPPLLLLGLLAQQGARAVAGRILGSSGTIRKVSNVLSKNFEKAQKEYLSKGKIPTEKTLTQGLTKDQKGLLSNQGLLSQPKQSGFQFPRPSALPNTQGIPPISARFTSPQSRLEAEAAARAQARKIAEREATKRLKANRLATIEAQQKRDAAVKLGLLGSVSLPLFFGGQEQPVVTEPTVIQEQPVIPQPRLMQVINPDVDATGREVLNAALLRAGLSLLRGDTIEDSLRRGISVTKAQNTFNTGEQALAAGRRNLGERATISVQQNADGTFRYAGREEPDLFTTVDNSIKQASKKVITQDIINRVKAMPQNSTLTDEEIIEGLKERGYVEEE